MITKNFRLNALANQYAAAIYNNVRQQNGGEWFAMTVGSARIEVAITGGVKGIRDLVDSYMLKPLKESFPDWESVGITLITKCVNSLGLTAIGEEMWQSMINDMGDSLDAGGFNEKH